MDRNAPPPDSTPRQGARVRVHSLVVTLLFLAMTFALVDQLAGRFNASHSPAASTSVGAGNATDASPSSDPTASPLPTPVPNGPPPVVYAAGDLADCPGTGPAVANLIRNQESLILALGDIVHPSGAPHEYRRCFDPGWGDLKARTRPVPGNHDYRTSGAAGYFAYFGALAGKPSQGYYSFDLGWWHIIAINSNCAPIGGCQVGSPQIRWLEADWPPIRPPARSRTGITHVSRQAMGRHCPEPSLCGRCCMRPGRT